jgi:hypothetical protein
MPQQLAFTIDMKLKDAFMHKTKEQGITMKAYLTFCIQAYINGKLWLQVEAIDDELRTPKLEKEYQQTMQEYNNWETVSLGALVDSLWVTQ